MSQLQIYLCTVAIAGLAIMYGLYTERRPIARTRSARLALALTAFGKACVAAWLWPVLVTMWFIGFIGEWFEDNYPHGGQP